MTALDLFEVVGGCLGWIVAIGAVLDAYRRRNDPARARIPRALRLTHWQANPDGTVQTRIVVEGLPPDDAAAIVEQYRRIVDGRDPT